MTLIVFSIPVMILAVAVAVVPLVVLSHRDHKERMQPAGVPVGAEGSHSEDTRADDPALNAA